MENNHYETVVILSPVLTDDQVKKTVEGYIKRIKKDGGKVVHRPNPAQRTLAYPIAKHTRGIYQVIQFTTKPEAIAPLEQAYKIDENIIRFFTIKLDRYGVAYYEKERSKPAKTASAQKASNDTTSAL
jgi:small subunit ribosomal protein S6